VESGFGTGEKVGAANVAVYTVLVFGDLVLGSCRRIILSCVSWLTFALIYSSYRTPCTGRVSLSSLRFKLYSSD
jgi:hypothetical protein